MDSTLNWNRLTNITKTVKPFRGTTNRFPIANRSHNTKCFYVEELDGETVYRVTYGYHYKEIFHTKEEWEKDPNKISCRDWEEDESKKYVTYTTIPRDLGIVRSDNTFQFTAKYYGQGDNTMLSGWGQGWFFSSSRHGGMVYMNAYRGDDRSIFHPIFEGMRINMNTMMPHESSNYQVLGRRVSRIDAKKFLTRYETFYKVNEVMFKTIDWKTLMDTAVDVVSSLVDESELQNYYISSTSNEKIITWADDNIDVAPLDSALAFAVGHDIGNMYRRMRAHAIDSNSNQFRWMNSEPMNLYANLKRKLNHELYKRHHGVMKDVTFPMGKPYPASNWGIRVMVDGKEVKQY